MRRRVQHLDFLAHLFVDAAFGFLTQSTFLNQLVEPGRQCKIAVPRIIRKLVTHGVDHVREHIQADNIQGAEGGALGASQIAPGQRVYGIEAEAESLCVMFGCQHRKHADAVGNKVGRVFRPHHALADSRHQKGFQLVEQQGVGSLARNKLDQMHISRRIEKMNAAKTVAQGFRKSIRQAVNGQTRGVGGKDGLRAQIWRNFAVQVGLPVHAFGDGLDHQIAIAQERQVLFVVGRLDIA